VKQEVSAMATRASYCSLCGFEIASAFDVANRSQHLVVAWVQKVGTESGWVYGSS
jgi:hypothetical protein